MNPLNLTLTPAAARFMRLMILADGTFESGFRMRITPGGCAGLTADVDVAAEPATTEQVVSVNGVKLFLDAQSRILLQDVTIDFVDGLASQGLVFHDPKQVTSCSTSQRAA